jgi:cardiolipin synthase
MAKKWHFLLFKNIPEHEKRITISTIFTLLRIVLIPFIIWSMIHSRWGHALVLFIAAALSDVVDGNLARFYNDHTFLGACLDPIADKLLVLSCFVGLIFIESPIFVIPVWFVLCILLKELIVLIGALYIYVKRDHIVIKPTLIGKSAAVVQMAFIVWVLAYYYFNWSAGSLQEASLAVVLCTVAVALVQYLWIGYHQLINNGVADAHKK